MPYRVALHVYRKWKPRKVGRVLFGINRKTGVVSAETLRAHVSFVYFFKLCFFKLKKRFVLVYAVCLAKQRAF